MPQKRSICPLLLHHFIRPDKVLMENLGLTISPAQLRLLSAAKFGTVMGQNSTAELTRGNLRFR